MLFEIERSGHAILLFGGSRPTTTAWSSPSIEALAASSDEFWNEIPAMGPEVQALVQTYGIDPARPLESWLSEEQSARVQSAAQATAANPSLIAHLRPWLAAQVLRMAADAKAGMNPEYGSEAVLTRRAIDAGVPVHSEFTTPEDVFASFSAMSREAELGYLQFTLYEIESGVERVTEHAYALANGDLSPIEEETSMMRREWPAFYDQLVYKRNHAWLPRFEAMMNTRVRAFVVVGTGHLVGDDGLLRILPGSGFSLRRREPRSSVS